MTNGRRAPQRIPSSSRTLYAFRLDVPTMDSVEKAIKRSYFGNMGALIESMLMQYASAYDYAIASMPVWKNALTSAPQEIRMAAEAYPPFLHYQFTSTQSHTGQEQGYFIRIRQFSSADTAVVEVYSPEPKTAIVPLAELTPIYCSRDIVNELSR